MKSPNPNGRPPHATDWRVLYALGRMRRSRNGLSTLAAHCDTIRANAATPATVIPDEVYDRILHVMCGVVHEDTRRNKPRVRDRLLANRRVRRVA